MSAKEGGCDKRWITQRPTAGHHHRGHRSNEARKKKISIKTHCRLTDTSFSSLVSTSFFYRPRCIETGLHRRLCQVSSFNQEKSFIVAINPRQLSFGWVYPVLASFLGTGKKTPITEICFDRPLVLFFFVLRNVMSCPPLSDLH